MTRDVSLDAWPAALGAPPVARCDLRPLPDQGAAHRHLAVGDTSWLLRLPRAVVPAHLVAQAEAFRRAAAIGVAPALGGMWPEGLLVGRIVGQVPRVPGDLPAIARALARLHAAPVPPVGARAPIDDESRDPAGLIRARVEAAINRAPAELRRWMNSRLSETSVPPPGPVAAIASDCHPGNFVIQPSGRAVLVDLERLVYATPAIDLAHATLPTSTFWDPRVDVLVTAPDLDGFHRAWLDAVPATLTSAMADLPAWRRLIFLRTVAWAVTRGADVARSNPGLAPRVARLCDPRALDGWWRAALD